MHPACAPVRTRTGLLGFYSSHPEIIRQIEGAGEAFFEADWDGDQLGIGRRVPDQRFLAKWHQIDTCAFSKLRPSEESW